jgi:feruloyl esterase
MVSRIRSAPALCVFAFLFLTAGASVSLNAQQDAVSGPTASHAAPVALLPVTECEKLAAAEIGTAINEPTHITSAKTIADGKPAPYCEVKGYVEPAVQFEVHLPLKTWTQRYVQTGCGGLCGFLSLRIEKDEGCLPATNGEVAVASTDMGHEGSTDGSFGAQDYQLRIDFAYRGVHVTALAAKALIEKFYGRQPKYSYFAGCSDGGREALMEAERFPKDFNGITAGAPAMNFVTQNTFYHGWNALVNTGGDGKPILTADKLPTLHKAAIEQCDAVDGLKDGLISDPFACHVDPSKVECRVGQDLASCLTPAQVKVARELYTGAHDAAGNKLVLSGPLPGSELAWEGVFIQSATQKTLMSPTISTGALKNLVYVKNPQTGYTLENLKFDRDAFEATTKLHGLYDATDPDLGAFASGGGKLILWHGLADPHISPLNTIAYYKAMQLTMGTTAVDKFARLYLFPGGYHCSEGEGPFDVNLLGAMMAWVEKGKSPDGLIASHSAGGKKGKIDRTRSVYPYPYTTRYVGTGSIDDAKNFVRGEAKPVPDGLLNWMGASFYAPHYELWCTANGLEMTCKPDTPKQP